MIYKVELKYCEYGVRTKHCQLWRLYLLFLNQEILRYLFHPQVDMTAVSSCFHPGSVSIHYSLLNIITLCKTNCHVFCKHFCHQTTTTATRQALSYLFLSSLHFVIKVTFTSHTSSLDILCLIEGAGLLLGREVASRLCPSSHQQSTRGDASCHQGRSSMSCSTPWEYSMSSHVQTGMTTSTSSLTTSSLVSVIRWVVISTASLFIFTSVFF